MTEAFYLSLLQVVYKRPSFRSYNEMTIVRVKSFNSFTLTMVILLYDRKLGFLETTFKKDKKNASVIELLH